MKSHTPSLDAAPASIAVSNAPKSRAEMEQRLLQINVQMANFTPDAFKLPDTAHLKTDALSPLQARLKNNELIVPDTEVLRQLLLEKADIAEQLAMMPQISRGLQLPKADFSVQSQKPKLG